MLGNHLHQQFVAVLLAVVVVIIDGMPNPFTNQSGCRIAQPGPLCDPYAKLSETQRREAMYLIKALAKETEPSVEFMAKGTCKSKGLTFGLALIDSTQEWENINDLAQEWKLDTVCNKSLLMALDAATLRVKYVRQKPCPIFDAEIDILIADNDHLLQMKRFKDWVGELRDGLYAIVTHRQRTLYGHPSPTVPVLKDEKCPEACQYHAMFYALLAVAISIACSVTIITRKFK